MVFSIKAQIKLPPRSNSHEPHGPWTEGWVGGRASWGQEPSTFPHKRGRERRAGRWGSPVLVSLIAGEVGVT